MDLEVMAENANSSAWRSGKWVKSSYSGGNNECVELRYLGAAEDSQGPRCAIRDSKNPQGPILEVGLGNLLAVVRLSKPWR